MATIQLISKETLPKTKILVMCQGGNSRSVSCGYILKYFYDVDALACGWEKNTPETLKLMCDWADAIIVMETDFVERVPEAYDDKTFVLDVGPDIWCNSFNSELLQLCGGGLEALFPKIQDFIAGKIKSEDVPIIKMTREVTK